VKVTMLLADAVQAAEGKLYILGGGWSIRAPDPVPMAIALYVQVPWDRTNEQHVWALELLDADGQPVLVGEEAAADEAEPVRVEGGFEVGRPPGLKPGTPIDVPLAINFGPIPLEPGARYEFRLEIDGAGDEDWRLAFSTRPAFAPEEFG
jgi:hypothetical protein